MKKRKIKPNPETYVNWDKVAPSDFYSIAMRHPAMDFDAVMASNFLKDVESWRAAYFGFCHYLYDRHGKPEGTFKRHPTYTGLYLHHVREYMETGKGADVPACDLVLCDFLEHFCLHFLCWAFHRNPVQLKAFAFLGNILTTGYADPTSHCGAQIRSVAGQADLYHHYVDLIRAKVDCRGLDFLVRAQQNSLDDMDYL